MVLDPIHALVSFDYYRKVAVQSLGRSILYLCYVGAIFALIVTFAIKLKVGPLIDETFDWLARSVPQMTYADGRITSSAAGPVKLVHPKMEEIAFIIDTTRVEPVSPTELAEAKVTAFLTAKAFYLRHRTGKVEVYDLSKGSADRPMQIDASFFESAKKVLSRVLYPMALAITFAIFLVWKLLTTLIYSLAALVINSVTQAGQDYGALFNLTVYAQTPVILLQALALFLPFAIPMFTPLALVIVCVYLWLALKQLSPSSSQPA